MKWAPNYSRKKGRRTEEATLLRLRDIWIHKTVASSEQWRTLYLTTHHHCLAKEPNTTMESRIPLRKRQRRNKSLERDLP